MKASRIEVSFWTTSLSRSFGTVIRVSTWAFSSSAARSATSLRLLPSKLNGLVTTPIVSAPCCFASWATTGAPPDPVPPPSPAVMNTMSESASAWAIFSESSSAARWPTEESPPAPRPLRDLVADPDLVRRVRLEQRLGIGVAGDELDAHHLGADHPVDGVCPASPDSDDPDKCEVLGIGTQRHGLSSGSPRGPGTAVRRRCRTWPRAPGTPWSVMAASIPLGRRPRGFVRDVTPMVLPAGIQPVVRRRTVAAPLAASLVVSVRLQPVAFGAERGGNGAPVH